jgi:hypothetical protein
MTVAEVLLDRFNGKLTSNARSLSKVPRRTCLVVAGKVKGGALLIRT